MIYTQIVRKYKRNENKMVTITKHMILFTVSFRDKFKIKQYVSFFRDEDNYLCFKFNDDRTPDSYLITINPKGSVYTRVPSAISENFCVLNGSYKAKERDGYIVTDCKLKER